MKTITKVKKKNDAIRLASKPYKFEINATRISHYGKGVISKLNFSGTMFIVRGVIINAKTNTELAVNKVFSKISGAEKYFADIIKEFPVSEIIIEKEVVTELKLYV